MRLSRRSLKCITLSLAALFVLCMIGPPAFAEDDILSGLIERQSTLNSVIASFVQEKYDPMLGRPIKSEGNFYFKPGVGVRWEYEDVLVLYDGTVLYVYSPEMKEAEKIRGEQGFMGPLAFDIKVLSKEYELRTSLVGDTVKLDLKPKKDMPFRTMTMLFDESAAFPSEVSITDSNGDVSTIRFNKVKINKRVGDNLFVFSPPPGTTINERDFE